MPVWREFTPFLILDWQSSVFIAQEASWAWLRNAYDRWLFSAFYMNGSGFVSGGQQNPGDRFD
jgi:hypothetical protein